jgi:hypothetical protein
LGETQNLNVIFPVQGLQTEPKVFNAMEVTAQILVKGFNPVRISGSTEWAGSSAWYTDESGQAEERPVCKPANSQDTGRSRVQIPPGPPNFRLREKKERIVLATPVDLLYVYDEVKKVAV